MFRQVLEAGPFGVVGFAEGSIPRMVGDAMTTAMEASSGAAKISPEEANRRYPGLPVPFKEPVYPEQAALISAENDRKKRNQAWIDRGPQTGWGTNLLVGLGGGIDPGNILAGIGVGAGFKVAGIAENLLSVYGQNLLGNALGQVPGYIQSGRERQVQDLGSEIFNAATGAVLGTGLHFAIKSGLEFFERTPKSVKERALKAALIQHENGKKIDVSPAVGAHLGREGGAVAPGAIDPYKFRELGHPSENQFFQPLDADTGANPTMGQGWGDGAYYTDSPAVARNTSGTPESAMDGHVNKVEIPKAAFFADLDAPLPEPLLKKLISVLSKAGVKDVPTLEQLADVPGKSALDLLRGIDGPEGGKTPLEAFNSEVKKDGYDGYRYTADGLNGQPNNRVMMFDPERAKVVETLQADKSKVPAMSAEQAKAASEASDGPGQTRLIGDDAAAKVGEAIKTLETAQESQARFKMEETEARARLEKAVAESPDSDLREKIDQVDRQYEADKREADAARALAECLSGRLL